MNREILFRGKRIDNGDWVYGAFVPDALEMLKGKRCLDGFIRRCNAKSGEVEMFEVDRETVGQFTGLIDKNGRKIFEGDIVDYNGAKYEVVFETRCSAYFGIKISHIETWQFCLGVPAKLMEVIGNIHDNPELLKGEVND